MSRSAKTKLRRIVNIALGTRFTPDEIRADPAGAMLDAMRIARIALGLPPAPDDGKRIVQQGDVE